MKKSYDVLRQRLELALRQTGDYYERRVALPDGPRCVLIADSDEELHELERFVRGLHERGLLRARPRLCLIPGGGLQRAGERR